MKPADLGRAVIEPKGAFPAGYTGTWKITYTAGKYGIDDGGSIIVARRSMSDAVMPQCENPGADGYVTAATDGDARLDVFYDNRYWIRPWRGAIVVKVYDGSLAEGDTVTVTLGDTSAGSPGWSLQTFPETRHTFMVLVDAFGTREYYEIAGHPHITIVPGPPSGIEAVLPSVAAPGEEVSIHVRVSDQWGNPVAEYDREVFIGCPDGCECTGHAFKMKRGVERVAAVRFTRDGIFRIDVESGGMRGKSNPVVVSSGSRRVFWGDMHGQTEQTVGTGTIEEYFRFARDCALIDAAGWQGNDFQVTDGTWEEVCELTKKYHEPGRFVTFLGYEWSGLTPAGGDHNILYREDFQGLYRSSHWQVHDGSSEETDRYPISELWNEFRGRDDVMAVAHVGGRYANFDYWDDEFSGLVEIHSHHGTFEWFAKEALRRGLLVGFVAQSDDHTGRPGLSGPLRPLARDFATFDVWGGYTGILAGELTRGAVWDALKARHCYATTGRRIHLDVTTPSGAVMGDVVTGDTAVELRVSIAGTAPLLDVEILRGIETVYRHPFGLSPEGTWVRIEWSGVRVRSRAKTADWDGIIKIDGGVVEEYRPYAFDQEGQGVARTSENELRVVSTTSGDIDGVFLMIKGDSPHITCENPNIRCRVAVDELEENPVCFDAGGVDLQMRFSLCSPFGRPENLAFEFRDDGILTCVTPYWVKVVQLDGHMAWSSPIYFAPRT